MRSVGDLLAFKVSRLGLKEGQAVGGLLGPIGELEGEFLSSAQHVGQLEAQHLVAGRQTESSHVCNENDYFFNKHQNKVR